jgi:hypothetical protein
MTLPLVITWILMIVYLAGSHAGMWGMFAKAGEPGWSALVPGYNLFVLVRISGLGWYWAFLFLIPLVNMGFWVVVCDQLALKFGKGVGTSLGLSCLSFVFFPLVGFGPDEHEDALRGKGSRRDRDEPRPKKRRVEEEEEEPRPRRTARREEEAPLPRRPPRDAVVEEPPRKPRRPRDDE